MLTFTKPYVLHTADFWDLLAGSALPNQGNGIRVGHSAKNFYQTDGNYREFLRKRERLNCLCIWTICWSGIKTGHYCCGSETNPSVNSEVRSTCQRSEVEHEPITSTLSEVSVKHTDGPCFSFRWEIQINRRKDYYNIRNEVCYSSENFTTLGFDGLDLTPLSR